MSSHGGARRIRIGIFHPADPVGPIPGGIDTVVRGILKYAPDDLDYTVFGATSDVAARPLGKEVQVSLGSRPARFMPVVAADPSARRGLMPLSVRYMWELRRSLRQGALRDIDIFDFHRIEPLAMFRSDSRPKNLMLHQDMAVIRDRNCDIGWRHAPWLYERLEESLFDRVSRIFCVRQSAVERYQATYPKLADRYSFIPTWVDVDTFGPWRGDGARRPLKSGYTVADGARIAISVGRLDKQKDPLLMLEALSLALREGAHIHLLMLGDGLLRPQVEQRISALGLSEHVTLLGARQPAEVAEFLQGSDLLVLSSAYEGMPIVVLEALASGLPVVTTRVGEVQRVVQDGINGAVTTDRTPRALADALCATIARIDSLRGLPCEQAVRPYHPDRVLSQIYDNHRNQGAAQSR